MWIQTHSGEEFDLFPAYPSKVKVEDIAHALAHLCRFTGHTRRFYSVAEHSVLMARQFGKEPHPDRGLMLAALMHDAAEAYLGGVSKPLKTLIGPQYEEITQSVQMAINTRYLIHGINRPAIKTLDQRMLHTERTVLLGPSKGGRPWDVPCSPLAIILPCWSPHRATTEFLKTFKELCNE